MNGSETTPTILIVEDNPQVCAMLERIFAKKGYLTLKAESGSHALNIATRLKPGVVILDLNLPDYNGIQLVSQIKAIDKAIQVIILTAHGSREAVRTAMESGAFDFFTKPFDFDDLCDTVRNASLFRPSVEKRENHHAP